jgi:uncharacterized protein
MSATSPVTVDAWRMVSARRSFSGSTSLAAFQRLSSLLTDSEGEVRYSLAFDRDAFGRAVVDVTAQASLPLQCQRTLERFLWPVSVSQRLGLITDEAQEAALPEELEPLLLPENGELPLLDLVEDELILAVPAVPVKPGTVEVEAQWGSDTIEEEPPKPNPFAALAALKDRKTLGE